MKKFIAPDLTDERIYYACLELQKMGYQLVNKEENADFALLGINSDKCYLPQNTPVINYSKDESFAVSNAYLTAEAAVSLAICESDTSLVNSKILIIGYGRIGKALHRYLSAFTSDITVCARKDEVRCFAQNNLANTIEFEELSVENNYDFAFNTVVHPVINSKEISAFKNTALLIELASFPGGIDTHSASAKGIKLVVARGLPGKYSPKTAGEIVAKSVDKIVKEELK